MCKIYNYFTEIEDTVKAKVPSILYKYRNFSNNFHKQILYNNCLWLAHPKTLNDPYDIRVPYRYNIDEVNHPIFFEKLCLHFQAISPHINPSSREFVTLCENQLELIKENPKKHFETNAAKLRDSDIYDTVGVFSLTEDPLNETMWAYYGDDSKGFCLGFDSLELLRMLNMSFGWVKYSAEPPLFSFLDSIDNLKQDWQYLKHSKWSHEKEFRIVTPLIESDTGRLINFAPSIIREVIVGRSMPYHEVEQIIDLLRSKYDSKVLLFQSGISSSDYGFIKNEIKY